MSINLESNFKNESKTINEILLAIELEYMEFNGNRFGGLVDFGTSIDHFELEVDSKNDENGSDEWLPAKSMTSEIFAGTVTYINKKFHIFVLDVRSKIFVEKMSDKIAHERQKQKNNVENHDWIKRRGQRCFCQYIDGAYYRASIRRIHESEKACTVCYL